MLTKDEEEMLKNDTDEYHHQSWPIATDKAHFCQLINEWTKTKIYQFFYAKTVSQPLSELAEKMK